MNEQVFQLKGGTLGEWGARRLPHQAFSERERRHHLT